jgi:hypothetical protein
LDYNPYAAPQVPNDLPPQGAGPDGQPQPWDIGDVLSNGWNALANHWPVLVFAPFVAALIGGIPNLVPVVLLLTGTVRQNSSEYWTAYSICSALGLISNTFFQVGTTRMYITAARGGTPEFGDIFSGGPRFLPVLGMTLLLILLLLPAFMLFIVPGVIVGLGLSLAHFYVIDAELGPIDALGASWNATKGHKLQIFLLGLVSFCVLMLGFMACCIGVYVALPVVMVAMATVYVRLSGRAVADTAGGTPL